jgi:hypothetical protein
MGMYVYNSTFHRVALEKPRKVKSSLTKHTIDGKGAWLRNTKKKCGVGKKDSKNTTGNGKSGVGV